MSDSKMSLLLPKKPLLEGRNHFFQLLILLLFVVFGMILFSAMGMLCATAIWGKGILKNPSADFYRLSQLFSTVGTFLLPALLFAYCHHRKFFVYNAANQLVRDAVKIACVCGLAFCLLPAIGLLVELNGMIHLPESLAGVEAWMAEMEADSNAILEVIMADKGWTSLILNLLVCAVLPAVCEEFFFRGTLQQYFHSCFCNHHIAIWLTAFIFSAIHLQFSGFFARMLLGAYLGYLFVWSGSLWLPVMAHLLHNAISIIGEYLAATGVLPASEDAGMMAQWPLLLASVVASALLLGVIARRRMAQRH